MEHRAKRKTLSWKRKGKPVASQVPLGSPLQRIKSNTGRKTSELLEGHQVTPVKPRGLGQNANYLEGIEHGKRLVKGYGKEAAKKEWLPFFQNSIKKDKQFYVDTQGTIAWNVRVKPYLQGKVRGIREGIRES